jgi:4-amino-4-deoxy-L-arabinose transferase-like glycosyltransferase
LRVVPAVIRRAAANNKLFTASLVVAFLLRVDAELGYRWQSWFNDSWDYMDSAVTLRLDPTRTSGYSLYLWLLKPFHSLALVTISQHLMGLLVAVMIYALAKHRFGAPSWVAVLATLPVLYDGFEIQLEHMIMSDTLFLFLVMAAITLVLWWPRPPMWACLLAGLLLGVSALVRSTGLPLIAVFAVYLIIRFALDRRWLSLLAGTAACCVAFALPVAAYAGWYDIQHSEFTMSDSTGVFMYSRVMTFAECSKMGQLPADLLSLCTTVPPDKRPLAQDYIWYPNSPLDRFPSPKFSPLPNKLAEQFAIKAIEGQPMAYARTVFDDTWRAFDWPRTAFPNADTYDEYLFGYASVPVASGHAADGYPSSAQAYLAGGDPTTGVVNPFAAAIRLYQQYIWLPGTVYGLILVVGLGGLVLAWRRIGAEALLPWACSVALIVIPAATAEFDYRYVLTAVPFGCLAAAMAFGQQTAGGRWLDRRLARRRGETSGTASLASGLAGGGLGSGTPDASDDKRDLAPDAS